MSQLESIILQYEKDFFSVNFCRDAERINDRLCLEFVEYGKSGKIYRREDTLNSLLKIKQDRAIDVYDFSVTLLDEDILIAHYVSHERAANLYALRTSIWKKEDGLWKMFFHQGTPCDHP